jgi:hypothetical protein
MPVLGQGRHPSSPPPLARSSMSMNLATSEAAITKGTAIPPEPVFSFPRLPLAGERVAGYRRDKRLLAPTR